MTRIANVIERMEANEGKEAGDDAYNPDDLIDLIKAIKFSQPEMSIKNVHREISITMANSADSYAFLKDVKLDEVKKVWKKALKCSSSESNAANKSTQKGDQPKIPADGIMKFYTVGDGSVKTLAKNYSKHHAQAAIAVIQLEKKEELAKYTHFFLDVPAELSGQRPHQALINFNDNNNNKKQKKSSSNKKTATSSSSDGREIFKIQAAQLPPGMEDVLTPILLYDKGRTALTFLHPPSTDKTEDDDGGYMKIKQMISMSGTGGALGNTGGQKAYFWGLITDTEDGPNIVSIDTSELAPSQAW